MVLSLSLRGPGVDTLSPYSPFHQLAAYRPHMFLSVHSGALGMYTPHAYDAKVPLTGQQGEFETQMLGMLQQLNIKSGECPFGAAGKEVGYTCPGTCLDYAFEQVNVPYSFAFEIYTSERDSVLAAWKAHTVCGYVAIPACLPASYKAHFTFPALCFERTAAHAVQKSCVHGCAGSSDAGGQRRAGCAGAVRAAPFLHVTGGRNHGVRTRACVPCRRQFR